MWLYGVDERFQKTRKSFLLWYPGLTMLEDDDSVFGAMRAEARGYILKGAGKSEVVHAITVVALSLYELNCQRATLEPPPPDMQPLFSALHSNPMEASRYMATLAGTTPPAEFFVPENMARIMNGLRQ